MVTSSFFLYFAKNINSNNQVGNIKQFILSFAEETINTYFLPLLIPEKYQKEIHMKCPLRFPSGNHLGLNQTFQFLLCQSLNSLVSSDSVPHFVRHGSGCLLEKDLLYKQIKRHEISQLSLVIHSLFVHADYLLVLEMVLQVLQLQCHTRLSKPQPSRDLYFYTLKYTNEQSRSFQMLIKLYEENKRKI